MRNLRNGPTVIYQPMVTSAGGDSRRADESKLQRVEHEYYHFMPHHHSPTVVLFRPRAN